MKAEITYCGLWNYKPEALRVGARLTALGCSVALVESGGGIFDISIDGMLKFSKDKNKCTGFPSTNEIDEMIAWGRLFYRRSNWDTNI